MLSRLSPTRWLTVCAACAAVPCWARPAEAGSAGDVHAWMVAMAVAGLLAAWTWGWFTGRAARRLPPVSASAHPTATQTASAPRQPAVLVRMDAAGLDAWPVQAGPQPAVRLQALHGLLTEQQALVARGQPLQAVQMLREAADGDLGRSVLTWLTLLALLRSLGDAAGFQQVWQALQQRMGPVPLSALTRLDGRLPALERHPALCAQVVDAWQSPDPLAALHDVLFAVPPAPAATLDIWNEVLCLAQLAQVRDCAADPQAFRPVGGGTRSGADSALAWHAWRSARRAVQDAARRSAPAQPGSGTGAPRG